jgi:hypothetical protein
VVLNFVKQKLYKFSNSSQVNALSHVFWYKETYQASRGGNVISDSQVTGIYVLSIYAEDTFWLFEFFYVRNGVKIKYIQEFNLKHHILQLMLISLHLKKFFYRIPDILHLFFIPSEVIFTKVG